MPGPKFIWAMPAGFRSDATINEADFIDAGHIRLGEKATFRPVAMEILDFSSGTKTSDSDIPVEFRPMLGSYMNVEQYRMFKIVPGNEGLAIDIPGRVKLDLNLPDDNGKWFPKMTREISLKPGNIVNGKAEKMIMHQYFRLKKISVPDSGLNKIPEELRKFADHHLRASK